MEEKPRKLVEKEIQERIGKLKGWKLERAQIAGIPALTKVFRFKDFRETLAFVNRVGETAESYGHHPEISIFQYSRCRIEIFTHSVQGLSEWDFELAELVDKIE